MKVMAQLEFNGNCREAFERYEQLFGGKIAIMNMFGETENIPLPPGSTKGDRDMVRFAELQIGDSRILGNDLPAEQYQTLRGFNVAAHIQSSADARRIFDGLADGGAITTPLAKVAWADLFGMVVDRFGVPWLVLALSE